MQIVIFFIVLCTYGFAPVGFSWKTEEKEVLMTSLAYETVKFEQKENLMIGPREVTVKIKND